LTSDYPFGIFPWIYATSTITGSVNAHS